MSNLFKSIIVLVCSSSVYAIAKPNVQDKMTCYIEPGMRMAVTIDTKTSMLQIEVPHHAENPISYSTVKETKSRLSGVFNWGSNEGSFDVKKESCNSTLGGIYPISISLHVESPKGEVSDLTGCCFDSKVK
ncbi:MAG: hypothetical protein ACXVCY_08810 [Pseudobdellovibrionaceae bacterium]